MSTETIIFVAIAVVLGTVVALFGKREKSNDGDGTGQNRYDRAEFDDDGGFDGVGD